VVLACHRAPRLARALGSAMSNPAPDPIVLRGGGGDVQCVAFSVVHGARCLLAGCVPVPVDAVVPSPTKSPGLRTLGLRTRDAPRLTNPLPSLARRDSNGDVIAWDLTLRRPLWRLSAHPPSAGVLAVAAAPPPPSASSDPMFHLLTQGRDGSVKCWRVPRGVAEGHAALPRDPAWVLETGAYHFCRFALLLHPPREEEDARESSSPGSTIPAPGPGSGSLAALAVPGEDASRVDVFEFERDPDDPRGGSIVDRAPAFRRAFRAESEEEQLSSSRDDETDDASERGGAPSATPSRLGTCTALRFVPRRSARDPAVLLAGYEEGTVAAWGWVPGGVRDAETRGDDLRTTFEPTPTDPDPDPDPSAASASRSTRIRRAPLWRSRAHAEAVTAVDADADGAGFVSAGADGVAVRHAIEWVVPTDADRPDASEASRPIRVGVVCTFAASPARPLDGSARVPRAATGGVAGVADVAIRGDGRIVALAGWDGRTRVRALPKGASRRDGVGGGRRKKDTTGKGAKDAGRKLASLGVHSDVVACVAFDDREGGFALATGSRDGSVALWPIFPPEPKDAAREREEQAEGGGAATVVF